MYANENSIFTWKGTFWVFLPTPLFCLFCDLFTVWWEEIAASSCQPRSLEMSDVLILPTKKHQSQAKKKLMKNEYFLYIKEDIRKEKGSVKERDHNLEGKL